jgi:lipopolysaccharide export system protein LptA
VTACAFSRRLSLLAATLVAALLVVTAQSVAQQPEKKSPGLFKASTQQRNEPVRIAALSLEVRDKSKLATFSGNVHIVQGDFNLRSNTLLSFTPVTAAPRVQGKPRWMRTASSRFGVSKRVERL